MKQTTYNEIEHSYSILLRAQSEDNNDKKKTLIREALMVNRFNFDAALELVQMNEDPFIVLKNLKRIMDAAEEHLFETENISLKDKRYIGDFYNIFATRPFIRIKGNHMLQLLEVGYVHEAIKEATELIELCADDELQIRYTLQLMYLMTNDLKHAEELRTKFKESSFYWNLPYALILFNLEKIEEAKQVMLDLFNKYPDAKDIILNKITPDPSIQIQIAMGVCQNYQTEIYTTLTELEQFISPQFLSFLNSNFKW